MAAQVVRNTPVSVAPCTDTGGADPEKGVCRYKRGEKESGQAVEQAQKLKIGHNSYTSRPKVKRDRE